MVTVHKETRYKSNIAILDNAHWKVQTLCYIVLKSDLPNGDKTSVWDNAVLFSACYSSLLILYQFYWNLIFYLKKKKRIPGLLTQCNIWCCIVCIPRRCCGCKLRRICWMTVRIGRCAVRSASRPTTSWTTTTTSAAGTARQTCVSNAVAKSQARSRATSRLQAALSIASDRTKVQPSFFGSILPPSPPQSVLTLFLFFTFTFLQLYCSIGISLMGNWVAFPRESQLQQSRATQPTVHAGCFSFSTIQRTLTWTTGSLTCATCNCTRGCKDTHKRVCTESWLWEKNPLLHQGIEPASAACQSDALPTELHPWYLCGCLGVKNQKSINLS